MAAAAGEGQDLAFLCRDMRFEMWFLRILGGRRIKLTGWKSLE
jgi:hypothetical protein